jgi:hypothetical protein
MNKKAYIQGYKEAAVPVQHMRNKRRKKHHQEQQNFAKAQQQAKDIAGWHQDPRPPDPEESLKKTREKIMRANYRRGARQEIANRAAREKAGLPPDKHAERTMHLSNLRPSPPKKLPPTPADLPGASSIMQQQEQLERSIGVPPRIIDHTGYETPASKAMRDAAFQAYEQKKDHIIKTQKELENSVRYMR